MDEPVLKNNAGHCGSWLASDEAISPDQYVACRTAIAGKPAPTEFSVFLIFVTGSASRAASAVAPRRCGRRRTGRSVSDYRSGS
ncbi:hypothetical protein DBV33_24505 [Pseudomonas fluorescens]|nr:hypothetical protein DBV33_24505 [Pseudomonas fluorescens]